MNNFFDTLKRNAAVLGVMGLGVLAVMSAVLLSRSTSTTTTPTQANEASCNITYTLASSTVVPTPPPCVGSIDVNLVMDRSSSMTAIYNGKSRLQWEKEAMRAFLEEARKRVLNTSNLTVRVGVTSYGAQGNRDGVVNPTEGNRKLGSAYNTTLHTSTLQNISSLTAYNNVVNAVNSVAYNAAGDGTCTECGIRIGRQQLLNTSSALVRANVLIADGLSNRVWDGTGYLENGNPPYRDEDPLNPANKKAVCEAAFGKGIQVAGCPSVGIRPAVALDYYVVGYGSGTNFNRTTLRDIATAGSDYYYENPLPSDWASSMAKVLDNLCEVSNERSGR